MNKKLNTFTAHEPAMTATEIRLWMKEVFLNPKFSVGDLLHLRKNLERLTPGCFYNQQGRGCLLGILTETHRYPIRHKAICTWFFTSTGTAADPEWYGGGSLKDGIDPATGYPWNLHPNYLSAKWLVQAFDLFFESPRLNRDIIKSVIEEVFRHRLYPGSRQGDDSSMAELIAESPVMFELLITN